MDLLGSITYVFLKHDSTSSSGDRVKKDLIPVDWDIVGYLEFLSNLFSSAFDCDCAQDGVEMTNLGLDITMEWEPAIRPEDELMACRPNRCLDSEVHRGVVAMEIVYEDEGWLSERVRWFGGAVER